MSKFSAGFMQLSKNRPGLTRELVASWKFIYGDVNFRAMHLFKYPHVSTFFQGSCFKHPKTYREHAITGQLNSANIWKPNFLVSGYKNGYKSWDFSNCPHSDPIHWCHLNTRQAWFYGHCNYSNKTRHVHNGIVITYSCKEVYPQCASVARGITLRQK